MNTFHFAANAIISLEDFQYLTSSYDWVLPFRIMVNIKHNTEKKDLWEKFQLLEAHTEERRNTWIWDSHRSTIIQVSLIYFLIYFQLIPGFCTEIDFCSWLVYHRDFLFSKICVASFF